VYQGPKSASLSSESGFSSRGRGAHNVFCVRLGKIFEKHELIVNFEVIFDRCQVRYTGCPRVAKKIHNLFVIKDINFFFILDDRYASTAYSENIAVYIQSVRIL
jgi:hypothetical protein